jgi:Small protein A (tmRNA-binding)
MRSSLWPVLILMLLIVGCATSHKINKISFGMTKQQVIEVLGPPVSTSAKSGVEYLNYRFSETDDDAFFDITTPYFVRIVDGKLESYGRLGDFDSTKTPETKSTIDLNINK